METIQQKRTTNDSLLKTIENNYIQLGREKIKQLRFDIKENIDYNDFLITTAIERVLKSKCDLTDKTLEVFKKHLR
jgi:hypothetical protein